MNDFFQQGPQLDNQFLSDPLLSNYLKTKIPEKLFAKITADLSRFGSRVVGDILTFGQIAERSPPTHIPYDPWGKRVDEIRVSPAWQELHAVAAEEGIVAIGYERKEAEWSRLYQFAKLYLFHPSSAFYSCPLAMTDGAARALELYGDTTSQQEAFRRLTSRSTEQFWTSGQWMTERTGGSDVGGTSTIARAGSKGTYHLHGTKWFTSATTSQVAMTLARIEGDAEGSRGLSLFYVELRDNNNALQNIQINRLKDKLGTKALPTAELSLLGTPAQLVGGPGHGVRKISSLFNITRIYNSICALGAMRKALSLVEDYAERRYAFGKKIIEHPLHSQTIHEMRQDWVNCFLLTFELAHLLGREETGVATEQEKLLLRLLTPVAKLYSAKKCISLTSEALECFGGAGYIEDTGLPQLLRDAQVFSIWEGTTNVLSLDMLRAISKENALPAFEARIRPTLTSESTKSLDKILSSLKDPTRAEKEARHSAFAIAELFCQCLRNELAELKPYFSANN